MAVDRARVKSPKRRLRAIALWSCALVFLGVNARAQAPQGFTPLFDGKSLAGWYGWNPHLSEKLTGEKKAANLAKQRAEFTQHWRVEGGELVAQPTGSNLLLNVCG